MYDYMYKLQEEAKAEMKQAQETIIKEYLKLLLHDVETAKQQLEAEERMLEDFLSLDFEAAFKKAKVSESYIAPQTVRRSRGYMYKLQEEAEAERPEELGR